MQNGKMINEPKEAKVDRVMELLFRAMKGESLSAQKLADEYNVSTRSITRDINNLRMFLSDHADIIGVDDLTYSSENHCYTLAPDNLLTNKELLSVTKVLIDSRAFNSRDLLEIIKK